MLCLVRPLMRVPAARLSQAARRSIRRMGGALWAVAGQFCHGIFGRRLASSSCLARRPAPRVSEIRRHKRWMISRSFIARPRARPAGAASSSVTRARRSRISPTAHRSRSTRCRAGPRAVKFFSNVRAPKRTNRWAISLGSVAGICILRVLGRTLRSRAKARRDVKRWRASGAFMQRRVSSRASPSVHPVAPGAYHALDRIGLGATARICPWVRPVKTRRGSWKSLRKALTHTRAN